MDWKSITTFVTDLEFDGAALDAAVALASREDAALNVVCMGIDVTHPDTYYAGAQAVAIALPGTLADAERQAAELEVAVGKRLKGSDAHWTTQRALTPFVGITQVVAEAARFSDVVVAARPYGDGRGQAQVSVVEAALFAADAPVLVVPDSGLPAHFSRVAIAWNDSPEALRTVIRQLPLLTAAESCEVIIVDPPRHASDRSDPGGRLAQMLARHGARASIRVLARTETSIARILARDVAETGADLLLMGAYGHSRLRESILGGATRDMLEEAKVPVLMMH